MTNGEKYKTVEERERKFLLFCNANNDDGSCVKCPLNNQAHKRLGCDYAWLDMEAEEEKPMPCPFCGKECSSSLCRADNCGVVACNYCGYRSSHTATVEGAIMNHNRVSKAVAANSTTINVGDTIAYRSCDDDQPEWKSFKVRFIEHGYLYENEDCSGDNIAIECAHKVVVRYRKRGEVMEGWIHAVIFWASTSMLLGSIGGCLVNCSRDYELHQVGIERIEHCHNVHSNWYEIVWKEEK